MTATPPTTGPTPGEVDDRDRWEKYVTGSLATTQAAAEKWRTGLAAFVTLVTGGLLIKGPAAAADLDTSGRLLISSIGGLGLLAAIVGLWLALRAAAGSPADVTYAQMLDAGGVRQFEVVHASKAAKALRQARVYVAISLVLLGATVIAWWWMPTEKPKPNVTVDTTKDQTFCGTLKSADGKTIQIQRSGRAKPDSIPFAEVDNIRVGTSCD